MSKARWIAAAAAGTAAVAAAAYYLNERNTEKPDYDLLVDEGKFALRRYPAMLVAETAVIGEHDVALGKGFRLLSDYIFARSRPGEKIAMTAPVLILPQEGEPGWLVRFVMSKKMRREDLPQPPAGIDILTLPQRKLAAIRFAGNADAEALREREAELREWMAGRDLEPAGPAEHGFYNSPFIPGPIRRNEVLIPVE